MPNPAAASVQRFVTGAFRANAYLAFDGAGAAALVDPGDDAPALLDGLRAGGARLAAVLLTHGHADHLSALADVLAACPGTPVWIAADDAAWCFSEANELPPYRVPPPPPDGTVHDAREGVEVPAGTLRFRVLATPGHSPGGVCYALDGVPAAPPDGGAPRPTRLLFSGDTLFADSVGRTDFPGSDPAAMERSLRRLAALPPETVVLSGHGPATTIGRERAFNPFLSGL